MLKCLSAALVCVLAVLSCRAEIVINEIHYDPDVKTQLVEFIELHNTGATAVDLSGWALTDAVDFVFPAGTSIAGGGYRVVAENPAQFNTKFRTNALGPWTGSLRNEGEEIILRDPTGSIVDRVEYKLGFPWPTVGEPPGLSIELANPAFDNDLGGNWRPSGTVASRNETTLIGRGSSWKYFKGTAEPSTPRTAWRELNFVESGAWVAGAMPIGYDPSVVMGTRLADMNGGYTTVYFRKTFEVDDPSQFASLQLQAMYDDGIKVWINGRLVIFPRMPSSELAFDGISTGSARESSAYDTFTLPPPSEYLVQGQNIIAIQGANVLKTGSSDFFVDVALIGRAGAGGVAPTPMTRNNSFTNNLPPAVRQVDHSPNQPDAGEAVRVTAKVSDSEGVASVQMLYQVVAPGSYIEKTDAAYATAWTAVAMNDAGTGGDEFAGDSVYTGIVPASVQTHRSLIRYRISATDTTGKNILAPYADDPSPNFAYFCYNGVPAWSGAIQPSSSDPVRRTPQLYFESLMRRLPVYHLISKKSSVETSTWIERYSGDEYRWTGTLVYDGKVYDHIHYRARGGVWRYAMGKNMWKMDFNRGHDFEPTDNWGRKYDVGWTKLNLGACIQQGDYLHRGEQGMFESVGFRLFNLAGIEGPHTHFIHFRIIDEAAETGANQYTGDFWGLYLAIEQEDSRFLEAHDLPDNNFYKMDGGTGELNNQGPTDPTDKSDLNAFLNALRSTQTVNWWRANFDVAKYYNYRTIVEAIHHYDIDGDPNKNFFYYTNGITRKWEVHPWDLDLTWANNMFGSGNEQFKSRVLPIATFSREYKNRVREIRDLLWNNDQAYKLIDEYAAMIYTPGAPSFVGADRAMWDYNPIMVSSYVNSSKAGQGRFYQQGVTKDFPGMVNIMKNYVINRGALLDSQAVDTGLPSRPTISNNSPANFPANKLSFTASAYAGSASFAAMKWRLGEITPAGRPAYDPATPRAYEIEPVWESPEITTYSPTIDVPSGVVRVGRTYRARVKMKDALNRWSNWSAPLEFVAGESDNATALVENLRVTEVMFNPPAGSDYEYIELQNISATETLDLSGARFTDGIEFAFPTNSSLAPGDYCLVVQAPNLTTFRTHYGLDASVKLYGPYDGSLNNDGEELTLKTTLAGTTIISFAYGDNGSWPVAADGAGHSIIPSVELPQNAGDFSYPGNWRASALFKGSPGRAEPAPLPGPVINEVMANTDFSDPNFPGYDSNDFIELANSGPAAVSWSNYYLSDDPVNLRKWLLPAGQLDSGAVVTFDETTGFHNPITSGFGISQAGESIFLSHLPGNGQDRVVDAVKFKGQSATASWSRLPHITGAWRAGTPTRGTLNQSMAARLVINEIMYHPATNTNSTLDNTADEYVEILNPTAAVVALFDAPGTWRIDGGIDYQFSASVTMAPGELIVLVNFSPTIAASSNAFRAKYTVPEGTRLFGPYSGKLGNDSDRVAIERPEAPDIAGEPLAWVVVDEVTYGNLPFWPVDVDGQGPSLHRISGSAAGNDPANWRSGLADPGRNSEPTTDTDGDGMPNEWELSNGLNPDSSADAALDADNDGISNLDEFRSGTNPRDSSSGLRIGSPMIDAGTMSVQVYMVAGKIYALEQCVDLNTRQWQTVVEFPANVSGWASMTDPEPANTGIRFYRVTIKPSQD